MWPGRASSRACRLVRWRTSWPDYSFGVLLHDLGSSAVLLAPAETATRKAFRGDNGYRLSRFLMTLGEACAGLGQFAGAEANLLEAHARFVRFPGPLPKDTIDSVRALVVLYTDWQAAKPGKGCDAKATEWQRRLDQLDAAATPKSR